MGSDRVELWDKVEWGEKCHYASDFLNGVILFERRHVSFIILLSYYFILSESEFLWET